MPSLIAINIIDKKPHAPQRAAGDAGAAGDTADRRRRARRAPQRRLHIRRRLGLGRSHTNGPYVSDFAIVGPPVGRATRPPAGPTAGNPAYSLETKGRWYQLPRASVREDPEQRPAGPRGYGLPPFHRRERRVFAQSDRRADGAFSLTLRHSPTLRQSLEWPRSFALVVFRVNGTQ